MFINSLLIQSPLAMRKQPVQKRAQLTIEAIFQATAQLVEREGMANLTTNKIALKAGFSVGTLYQYFSSKDEIFRALVQFSREQVLKELCSYMYRIETKTDKQYRDPEDFFKHYIAICCKGFAFGDEDLRCVHRLCWMVETPEECIATLNLMIERLHSCLNYIKHPYFSKMSGMRCYVLNRSLMGCLRSASLEKMSLENAKEFEDALLEMTLGQLQQSLSTH